MNTAPLSSSQEWRENWTLVLASMAGLSFIAIAGSSLGLFIEPLSREFGWSRAQISSGLTIYALIAVPLSPFVGAMVDRWGARRIGIPGMVLASLAFAGFSLANGSMIQWIGLWAIYSFVALAIRNTIWTAAVTSVFTSARGLALAFTLSGAAITQTLIPVVSQRLIDGLGWRSAYVWIGLGWGALVLILLVLFFYDARDSKRRQAATVTDQAAASTELPGLSPAEALRSAALIKIAVATLIALIILSGISVHLVPVLNERGISRETAALMAGLAGIMAIAGKLLTGWMQDRWTSGWINSLSLAAPAVSCLILLVSGSAIVPILLAVALIGYTNGAFIQVCAYLTGRYGGVRNYGRIFGVMASIIALAVGIGPMLSGLIFDLSGSYAPLLAGSIPCLIVSGLMVFALGPYPDWGGEAES